MATTITRRKNRRRSLDTGCGTSAAYQRHIRVGEEPCSLCLAALATLRVDMDRIPFEEHVANGVMRDRPDLADMPVFGAAHYTGLVMGA